MRSRYFLSSLILLLTVLGSGCAHRPDRLPGPLDFKPLHKPGEKSAPVVMTTDTPINMQDYCENVPKIPDYLAERMEGLNKKIKERPQDVTLYMERGRAYSQLVIGESVSSNSRSFCYLREHGWQAQADFDMVIKLEPANAEAYFERANPLLSMATDERLTSSVRYIDKAVSLEPNNLEYRKLQAMYKDMTK